MQNQSTEMKITFDTSVKTTLLFPELFIIINYIDIMFPTFFYVEEIS